MSDVPNLNEALVLEPLKLIVVLPSRIARRLRVLAHSDNRSAMCTATTLLTHALVPDARERKRLADRDFEDVQGDDRHSVASVEEQEPA